MPSLSCCRLIIILLFISYLILLKSVHTFSSYNSSLDVSTCSVSMSYVFLTYFSIVWRLRAPAILLVVIITFLLSMQMKSAMTSNLMLVIYELKLFMNLLVLSKLIRMIICFLDGLFVVIFSLGLSLLSPLIIFWMFLIFLFWRLENTSLIFRVSLVVLALVDDT